MSPPKWSNGALIDAQYPNTINPVIWVVERQSSRAVPFAIPGAKVLNIFDWDYGADGTIALSGNSTDADGRISGFVAWISSNETTSNVIRTASYRPARMTIGPDGTLWAAGSKLVNLNSQTLKPEGAVIRQFDRSGKMLASFVPQSTIRAPISLWDPGNRLRASRDRIAWYSPAEGRYVEISSRGVGLLDIAVPPPGDTKGVVGGLGLTDKGDVFASTTWYTPPHSQWDSQSRTRRISGHIFSGQTRSSVENRTSTNMARGNASKCG